MIKENLISHLCVVNFVHLQVTEATGSSSSRTQRKSPTSSWPTPSSRCGKKTGARRVSFWPRCCERRGDASHSAMVVIGVVVIMNQNPALPRRHFQHVNHMY